MSLPTVVGNTGVCSDMLNCVPATGVAVHVRFPVVNVPFGSRCMFDWISLQPSTWLLAFGCGPATPRASLICQPKLCVPPGPTVSDPTGTAPGLLPAWNL